MILRENASQPNEAVYSCHDEELQLEPVTTGRRATEIARCTKHRPETMTLAVFRPVTNAASSQRRTVETAAFTI